MTSTAQKKPNTDGNWAGPCCTLGQLYKKTSAQGSKQLLSPWMNNVFTERKIVNNGMEWLVTFQSVSTCESNPQYPKCLIGEDPVWWFVGAELDRGGQHFSKNTLIDRSPHTYTFTRQSSWPERAHWPQAKDVLFTNRLDANPYSVFKLQNQTRGFSPRRHFEYCGLLPQMLPLWKVNNNCEFITYTGYLWTCSMLPINPASESIISTSFNRVFLDGQAAFHFCSQIEKPLFVDILFSYSRLNSTVLVKNKPNCVKYISGY